MTIASGGPPPAPAQRRLPATLAAILGAGLIAAAPATPAEVVSTTDAETVGTLFNWYYATAFGTGVYTIGETRVSVLTVPLAYTLREPDADHWGVRLTLPASVALGSFDLYDPDLDSLDDIRLAAWSLLPGAEVVIPLAPHWRMNPFANFGWAKERETGAGANVYQAGVSTMYAVPAVRYPELEIGGKYVYAGFRSDNTDSEPISLAALGIAAGFPTAWTLVNGRQAIVGVHWIGTRYFTDIRFRLPGFGYSEIHSEYELGLTFGLRPAVKILGVPFDRIGLGYVTASDGLRGIRLVTKFPF